MNLFLYILIYLQYTCCVTLCSKNIIRFDSCYKRCVAYICAQVMCQACACNLKEKHRKVKNRKKKIQSCARSSFIENFDRQLKKLEEVCHCKECVKDAFRYNEKTWSRHISKQDTSLTWWIIMLVKSSMVGFRGKIKTNNLYA